MLRTIVLIIGLLLISPGAPAETLRVATFNIAMGLEDAGLMGHALEAGDDSRLIQIAEILQRTRPDIVLLNEFDFDPSVDAAGLLNRNYLAQAQNGQQTIDYPYHFRAPVNTGVDSGLDLDGDGALGGPGDAWGYGQFTGQYGMLVLSRYPLAENRTFQLFRWADMPGALRPMNRDGSDFYPDETWNQLRLSSKSHWDLAFDVGGNRLHLLAHHPTPPVFDGPEDRNGRRNFDEIRFWLDYIRPGYAGYIVDDEGLAGGIASGAWFVVAGDFNADPQDGDSLANAIGQLLGSSAVSDACVPVSHGAREAALAQGGVNDSQAGDPAADTADFNDRYTGNLRLDYVIPSSNLQVTACGVFWPAQGEPGHALSGVSDHHLVWVDIAW